MIYQTYPADESLQSCVKLYWTLESPAEENPVRQRIIPDGCMEMIFHLGDLYMQYSDENTAILQPRCFVIGQLTRPLEIQPTGVTDIFSVRFHPNGFMPFTRLTASQFENTAVPLDIVFGEEGNALAMQVTEATSVEERIALVEKFLLHRLAADETIDRVVKSTVEIMLSSKGQVTIEEIADQWPMSRRQLERRFSKSIGLSPKQLGKIIRLQSVLRVLAGGQFTSLTAVAYQGDYYDQAHFIRDFKEFTGMTPKDFFRDDLSMSALFSSQD